jgi:hypothetical protein
MLTLVESKVTGRLEKVKKINARKSFLVTFFICKVFET